MGESPWGFESLHPHRLEPMQVALGAFRLPRTMADTVLVHPNRDKPEAKATKAAVILLLLTSAALILIVTVGGWSELQGAQIVSVGYILIYAVMAY